MRFEHLEPLLGLSTINPICASGLKDVGVDSQSIKMAVDEHRTYIERLPEGVSLVFTDESFFLGKDEMPIGTGEVFLSGLFLYPEGKDGYSQYPMPLPFGLRFEDTADVVRARLGVPEWYRENEGICVADRWTLDSGRRLQLTYTRGGSIGLVSFYVPDRSL